MWLFTYVDHKIGRAAGSAAAHDAIHQVYLSIAFEYELGEGHNGAGLSFDHERLKKGLNFDHEL